MISLMSLSLSSRPKMEGSLWKSITNTFNCKRHHEERVYTVKQCVTVYTWKTVFWINIESKFSFSQSWDLCMVPIVLSHLMHHSRQCMDDLLSSYALQPQFWRAQKFQTFVGRLTKEHFTGKAKSRVSSEDRPFMASPQRLWKALSLVPM